MMHLERHLGSGVRMGGSHSRKGDSSLLLSGLLDIVHFVRIHFHDLGSNSVVTVPGVILFIVGDTVLDVSSRKCIYNRRGANKAAHVQM